MDAQDFLMLSSMCAGLAGFGYVIASLRASSRSTHQVLQPQPHTQLQPLPVHNTVSAAAPAPTEVPSTLSTANTPANDAVAAAAPAVSVVQPVGVRATAIEQSVARVDYEEDAEIDPTKVGAQCSPPPPPPAAAAPKRPMTNPPLKRIVYDEDAAIEEPTNVNSLFLVSATAQTDVGRRRKRNEDSVLVYDDANLFVVADGMGGYRGGALASQLAVKTIRDAFQHRAFAAASKRNTKASVPREASELACAIQLANEAILATAACDGALSGMGTTLCAARFSPNKRRLYIGHVGDSRCYRLRAGVFQQMTADHTMLDFGITGPESAQLSRAVGIWPTVPIDIVMAAPLPGDVYLICSDGLTKMVPDETIASVLRHEEDPKAAVERLILFANAHGGKDNTTVVLVRVVPPDWKAARPRAQGAQPPITFPQDVVTARHA